MSPSHATSNLLRAASISRRAEDNFFRDLSTFFMSSWREGKGEGEEREWEESEMGVGG